MHDVNWRWMVLRMVFGKILSEAVLLWEMASYEFDTPVTTWFFSVVEFIPRDPENKYEELRISKSDLTEIHWLTTSVDINVRARIRAASECWYGGHADHPRLKYP
jgi:hypothetical protein